MGEHIARKHALRVSAIYDERSSATRRQLDLQIATASHSRSRSPHILKAQARAIRPICRTDARRGGAGADSGGVMVYISSTSRA